MSVSVESGVGSLESGVNEKGAEDFLKPLKWKIEKAKFSSNNNQILPYAAVKMPRKC
jgi:hypothetical protein